MGRSTWVLILQIVLVSTMPAIAGGVAITSTTLTDNGDGDGFADTRETITLHVTVRNTSGVALEDVSLTLYTTSPSLACLSTPTVQVGNLAPDETRAVPDGFVFTVGSVDRATLGLGPLDPLAVTFHVRVGSTPDGQRAFPGKLTLDLDLDVSGGSGSTSFFESFESTQNPLGQFEVQNLDAGRASLAASDGYRCQYNDPDYSGSNTFGTGNASFCFLGANAVHASAVWWGQSGPETSPAGGRGFSGFHSLFFGLDLGPPLDWTTPVGIIEAASMIAPVSLAATGPLTLSFMHQASFADFRAFANLPPGLSYDRGVVSAQLADDQGNPVGPWFKLEPYQNGYDQQNHPVIVNCAYDPIDDGSTEDDYLSPGHPQRRYGPSSTCYPEYTFVHIGETSSPYAASNLGYAEGPGLQGLWGIGTWVETKVDLGRFRGRNIRVRFLATTVNALSFETWEQPFQFNPHSGDDGWWIDDVRIDGVVMTPATVTVDTNDNGDLPPVTGDGDSDGIPDICDNCIAASNAPQYDEDIDGSGDACDPCRLNPDNTDPDADFVCGTDDNCPFTSNPAQQDADRDGFGEACDCSDAARTIFPGAPEVNDGLDNQCPGDHGFGAADEISGTAGFHDPGGDKTLLSWPHQAGAQEYEVVRSNVRDFASGCVLTSSTVASTVVSFVPGPQEVSYLLVRSLQPFAGSWGPNSLAASRALPCSP